MRDAARDRAEAGAAADSAGGDGGALAGGADAAVICAGLAEAACVANRASGCEPVFGATAALPSGEQRYAGCRTAGQGAAANGGCDDALSCGVSPVSGECWGFPSTCVPDGWIASSDATRWPADCDEVPSGCPAHCQCQARR